ncbi:hypothetical protein FOPE_12277 [Fonsecaea pedrosoi]|nr:hypothetical protein FOPE_12277 [Fonsecaea pedrosoi]
MDERPAKRTKRTTIRADVTTSPSRATPRTRIAAGSDETTSAEGDRGRETPPTDGGIGADQERDQRTVSEIGTGTGIETRSASVIEIEIETEEVAVDETEMSMAMVGERGAVTDSEIQKVTIKPLNSTIHTCSRAHATTDYRAERSHRRSRSRSPARNGGRDAVRTRSPLRRSDHDRTRPRDRNKTEDDDVKPPKARGEEDVSVHADKPVANGDTMAIDEDDEDALLRKMMGFTMFKTTHNTKVPGNQIYGVRKEKKTTYRQYMNRVGGFNRPLSPSR